jgi:hypothetical protein
LVLSVRRLGCIAVSILLSGVITTWVTGVPIVWLASLPFLWFGAQQRLGMNAYTAAAAASVLSASAAVAAIALLPSRLVHRFAPRHPNVLLLLFVGAVSTLVAFITLFAHYVHGPVSNIW